MADSPNQRLNLIPYLADHSNTCHKFTGYYLLNRSSLYAPSLSSLHIRINFFMKYESLIVNEHDSLWSVVFDEHHTEQKVVTAAAAAAEDSTQLSFPELTETIKEALEFAAPESLREQLAAYACENLGEIEAEIVAGCNLVNIDIGVNFQRYIISAGEEGRFTKDDACSICLGGFSDDGRRTLVYGLPCSHFFHLDCVENWLERRRACPLCRREVPPYFAFPKPISNYFS